ncbi:disulfide bond formation protein B [Paracoccus aerodenitrificans]|uniref:disulfide bond formation protein B n=1 Tax=Paracoccus aerodenitrificans TaxID=3017781 RepID=UPI0022F08EA8|nr:disulfide bond formation protein B [Paracoccus aerodenitrificans]WBU64905.1 disulfide bond formation protein B [Paracoccus aerodenitrificans]
MIDISSRNLALLAGAGSAALLITALAFQAIGYIPCELCILQRWPHLAAALIAGALIFIDSKILRWLGALATGLACAFAIYHSGVEFGWWQGPTACSGGISNLATLSTQELMAQLETAPVVRCDQPQWYFLGLTMAAWNAICSAILTGMWLRAAMGRDIRI